MRTLDAAWADRAPGSDVWPSIREMGLTEILFPEDLGGAGGSLNAAAVVMTALGRTLTSAPYLSSIIMSGLAVRHAADEATRLRLLPDIAAGSRTAALVCDTELSGSAFEAVSVASGELSLTGVQHAVLDGAAADALLVIARGADGPELALIDDRRADHRQRTTGPVGRGALSGAHRAGSRTGRACAALPGADRRLREHP